MLFGNNQGIGVESFEECMVFLNENPQVGNVIFPDGWSSAELDNIPQVQEAMPLIHVYMDFVPIYYGQKAKKATQLACRDTEKADY